MELDGGGGSFVGGYSEVEQMVQIRLHQLLLQLVQIPHREVVLDFEDDLNKFFVDGSVFQHKVVEAFGLEDLEGLLD